ncbi:MAG: ribosome silencing factor [Spirochaetes bacterium GWD1_27_9]|nr:MAG: ribosome silencing factor [Spirochaetes bacterium GWB1_27_13]OHD24982.1 MAG: ribosome silencing factor [Spirochaetes bacterium GWC1_27_15]OHD44160.1 MAG: ribosome silencing factor [Spirochaetes bacterium GWD1_27_9]
MEEKIIKDLVELIDSKKGEDIAVIDVKEILPVTNYVFVVTANSSVHAHSLAKYIISFFVENSLKNFLHNKSIDLNNPWILIDGGDIIVNVFLKETREFYNLEKLYFKGSDVYKPAMKN